MSPIEILFCIFLIFLSGYLAASEIALFSLSRFQLRSLRENFRPAYRRIKRLLSDPGGLLVSILVSNEILNITLSTLITKSISKHSLSMPPEIPIPEWAVETLLGVVITTPLILFLCEITPKVIGNQINLLVAPLTSGPLTLLYDVFKPVRSALKFVLTYFAKNRAPIDAHLGVLKESEFLLMVEEGRKEGAIQQSELDLIKNVFELDDTEVSEISTPLSQVLCFPVTTTLKGALAAIRSERYSRIPILSVNKKEVAGILYAKDLLRSKLADESALSHTQVATLMRKPFFVHPAMRLNALFRNFKQHKIHMAIVKTADGHITGVVTMSDILDYLFEESFSEESFSEKSGRNSK